VCGSRQAYEAKYGDESVTAGGAGHGDSGAEGGPAGEAGGAAPGEAG
jgi:hypothetical protein